MLVTPHVGVWIETEVVPSQQEVDDVTPHVGVWIETDNIFPFCVNS